MIRTIKLARNGYNALHERLQNGVGAPAPGATNLDRGSVQDHGTLLDPDSSDLLVRTPYVYQ